MEVSESESALPGAESDIQLVALGGNADSGAVTIDLEDDDDEETAHTQAELRLPPLQLQHMDKAGASAPPDVEPPNAYDSKRALLISYFQCNSSPFDLKSMLDIVTHGVIAHYPSKTLRGKREFFFHQKASLAAEERCMRFVKLVPLRIWIDGHRAVVRWRYEYQPICCLPHFTLSLDGYNEFEFEEFSPLADLHVGGPALNGPSPSPSATGAEAAPQPLEPVRQAFRISRIRTKLIRQPPLYMRAWRILFCCCASPPEMVEEE